MVSGSVSLFLGHIFTNGKSSKGGSCLSFFEAISPIGIFGKRKFALFTPRQNFRRWQQALKNFIEKKKLTLLVEVLSKDETSIRLPSIGSGEDREMVLTFKMEKNHVLWSCRSNRLSTKKHAQSSIRCKEQDEMVWVRTDFRGRIRVKNIFSILSDWLLAS